MLAHHAMFYRFCRYDFVVLICYFMVFCGRIRVVFHRVRNGKGPFQNSLYNRSLVATRGCPVLVDSQSAWAWAWAVRVVVFYFLTFKI